MSRKEGCNTKPVGYPHCDSCSQGYAGGCVWGRGGGGVKRRRMQPRSSRLQREEEDEALRHKAIPDTI